MAKYYELHMASHIVLGQVNAQDLPRYQLPPYLTDKPILEPADGPDWFFERYTRPRQRFDIGPVTPYIEPTSRFTHVPETLALDGADEKGWDAYTFIDDVVTSHEHTNMLVAPFQKFIHSMAQRYYDDLFEGKDKEEYKYYGKLHPFFADIRGSTALGGPWDTMYHGIATSIQVLKQNHAPISHNPQPLTSGIQSTFNTYAEEMAKRGSADLDIAFISPDDGLDTYFILEQWAQSRHSYIRHTKEIGENGTTVFRAKNYEVIERIQDGKPVYEGWRLIDECGDDGTHILSFVCGVFESPKGFKPDKEHTLQLKKKTFSIGLSARPRHLSKEDSLADTRSGDYVTLADQSLRFRLKTTTYPDMQLAVGQYDIEWSHHTYGRWRLYIIDDPDTYKDTSRIIEMTSRATKQMAMRVGTFGLPPDVALTASATMTPDLWDTVSEGNWTHDLLYNIVGSTHLSPLVTGINLIADEQLDRLPDRLKIKLAIHGMDRSLSIGKLWPHFAKMSDEQVTRFVDALPDQESYVQGILTDPQEPTRQGLYYLVRAAQQAGLAVPDFKGNTLLQARYLFRHPDDQIPQALEIMERVEVLIDQPSAHHGILLDSIKAQYDQLVDLGLGKSELVRVLKEWIRSNDSSTAIQNQIVYPKN